MPDNILVDQPGKYLPSWRNDLGAMLGTSRWTGKIAPWRIICQKECCILLRLRGAKIVDLDITASGSATGQLTSTG